MAGEKHAPITIGPDDSRYPALSRGFNQRWVARPDQVMLVRSTDEVVAALRKALRERRKGDDRRITVRSGGHCYEDFVSGSDVRVILDISPMTGTYYDRRMKAYCVEAGATNWHAYSHLYPATGRALPGGSCYSVGIGGHIPGGGYGLLSRQYGLTVDYLYGVEVVVVDHKGKVRTVRARLGDRRTEDLVWAHTGGGGGNFGVVTRFWFRDLPRPPALVRLCGLAWNWKDVKQEHFHNLLNAYGRFCAENQDPSTHAGRLFALLKLTHVSNGQIALTAQVDCESDAEDDPGARAMHDFLDLVDGEGVTPRSYHQTSLPGEHAPVPEAKIPRVMPWLTATQALNSSGENRRGKYKSAYIRRPFTPDQIDAMWTYLGHGAYEGYENKEALIQIDTYGSAINDPPRDTAVPQRDSIMKMQYQVYWSTGDPKEDTHVRWIRDAYSNTFAATNGVPEIGGTDAVTDGCYVNYPDADLSDDAWNPSDQPWSRLYYKDLYPRLQEVKTRWDPNDVFRHRQSIRPLTRKRPSRRHWRPGRG